MPPTDALVAFSELKQSGLVKITKELEESKDGSHTFSCFLPVPQPNPEALPTELEFEVRLPRHFPSGKVSFAPTDPAFHGFPHQGSARQGRELCLRPSNTYPRGATERLLEYVKSAMDWVSDAASGQLLRAGEPWELPDFRVSPEEDTKAKPLFFAESSESFGRWSALVGKSGYADLTDYQPAKRLIVSAFTYDGKAVHSPRFSKSFHSETPTCPCVWVLLQSLIYVRHRAPATFGELAEMCSRDGLDLWAVVKRCAKKPSKDGFHYLLMGAPIPRIVSEPPTEIHWQAMAISDKDAKAVRDIPRGFRQAGEVPANIVDNRLRDAPLPWVESTNADEKRLTARGTGVNAARARPICLFGCGAIGSALANHLARNAYQRLDLFDGDVLEIGNLSRHALPAVYVGLNKAAALAHHLQGLYPGSTIEGHQGAVPKALREGDDTWKTIMAADILLDCTTDDIAQGWLSSFGKKQGKTVLSLHINAGASMLSVICSGKHINAVDVARRLYRDIADGTAPFTPEEYDPDISEVLVGAGCWAGAFPARGADIAALVASSLAIIEKVVADGRRSRGAAYVLRRHAPSGTADPLVELALHREYR